MIAIKDIKYDIAVLLPNGERLSLSKVATGISWEEQSGELAARLQFRVLNQKLSSGWLHQKLPLGARTVLRADWGEGFRNVHQGIIFDWHYENDALGILSITAYDNLIHLLRSKDERYYPNGTKARVIIEDIAKAWNIPLGQINIPDMTLSKQIFRRSTLAGMLEEVLEQIRQRGGGRYVIRSDGGRIHIVPYGQNQTVYKFPAEVVQHSSDRQDIEDLITRVKIIGKENNEGRAPVVATMDGRTEFGILQEIVYEQHYDTAAAARAAAEELLKERGAPRRRRNLTAPDLPFLRRGDKIHVAAGTLLGYFAVVGVRHNADQRTMTMEVESL